MVERNEGICDSWKIQETKNTRLHCLRIVYTKLDIYEMNGSHPNTQSTIGSLNNAFLRKKIKYISLFYVDHVSNL